MIEMIAAVLAGAMLMLVGILAGATIAQRVSRGQNVVALPDLSRVIRKAPKPTEDEKPANRYPRVGA